MSEVITIRDTRHVVWECRSCGVISTCPESIYEQQRAEGGFHHCPNGHQWGWSKDNCERENLRRERDQLKQQIAYKDDEIATKGKELMRLQKRVRAGVCPCCNRTFTNVARHMKTKHPNIVSLPQKQKA